MATLTEAKAVLDSFNLNVFRSPEGGDVVFRAASEKSESGDWFIRVETAKPLLDETIADLNSHGVKVVAEYRGQATRPRTRSREVSTLDI